MINIVECGLKYHIKARYFILSFYKKFWPDMNMPCFHGCRMISVIFKKDFSKLYIFLRHIYTYCKFTVLLAYIYHTLVLFLKMVAMFLMKNQNFHTSYLSIMLFFICCLLVLFFVYMHVYLKKFYIYIANISSVKLCKDFLTVYSAIYYQRHFTCNLYKFMIMPSNQKCLCLLVCFFVFFTLFYKVYRKSQRNSHIHMLIIN